MERVFESPMTVREELITPETADHLLQRYKYEYQRKLSPVHVAYLADQMRKGLFTTNTVILARLHLGGSRPDDLFLVNGQHTLWAIFESGVPMTLPVMYYNVSSEEELALLYTTLDTGKTRMPAEGYAAFRLGESLDLPDHQLNALYAATKIVMADFQLDRIRRIGLWEIEPQMRRYAPAFKQYVDEIIDTPIGVRSFMRRDLAAVGIVTMEAMDVRASRFWRQVAMDDGLSVGDPRKTLNNWIRENKVSGRGRVGGMTIRVALRSVVAAWNAWYEERELRFIRVPRSEDNRPLPGLPIKGTRYVVGGAAYDGD